MDALPGARAVGNIGGPRGKATKNAGQEPFLPGFTL